MAGQIAPTPPSTASAWPVMKELAGSAANRMAVDHFVDFGHPLHRHAACQFGQRLGLRLAGDSHETVDHRRPGEGRADGVDAHALGRVFGGRRAGQTDDAVLGGGIDRELRRADQPGDRGDVDDGAAPGRSP